MANNYIAEIAHSDDEGSFATVEQQDANRKLIAASPALLKSLTAVLPYAENECQSLYACCNRDGDEAAKRELDACETVIEQAQLAIATATDASSPWKYTKPEPPILVVRVRGGLIEDMDATAPITVVVEDWDVIDDKNGKKPLRNVWKLTTGLSPKKAARLRRLTTNV